MAKLPEMLTLVTRHVSLLVLLVSIISYISPGLLKPLAPNIPYLLGLIMLGMGLTMTTADFRLVFTRPGDVFFGVLLRYAIMPVVAWGVAAALQLPPALAAGVILVGCCPSGTASNVMTFLAKGDVALSVSVSSLNTLLAPLLTPTLFLLFGGAILPVPAGALFADIVKIVLVPLLAGMLIRILFARQVDRLQPVVPALSALAIVVTVGAVIAVNAARLEGVAWAALLAVMLHNGLGLLLGYLSARSLRMGETKARAITYEIGMENSGLAAALALAHLDPVAAVPGAIFSVWHNLSGSVLAGYWSKQAGQK